MIELVNINGNPNIGVFIFANNHIALVPTTITSKLRKTISDVLDVDIIETKISDMIINGVMIAGNDKGILLPRITKTHEFEYLKEAIGYKLNIKILDIRQTALGNLIVANNRGALVSPLVDKTALPIIKETLGVEIVHQTAIASIPTVGSLLVITNKGGLVHPGSGEDEIKMLANVFGVDVLTATVNFGLYFVKAGIVANDKGALVGDETTGPELMRIQQALRYPAQQ